MSQEAYRTQDDRKMMSERECVLDGLQRNAQPQGTIIFSSC